MIRVVGERHRHPQDGDAALLMVRNAAQSIIEAKKATYYGIGMALARITRAIFSAIRVWLSPPRS